MGLIPFYLECPASRLPPLGLPQMVRTFEQLAREFEAFREEYFGDTASRT